MSEKRITVELDHRQRDWLLKKVLDRMSEIEIEPSSPDVDEPLLEWLAGLRDKLRPQETENP